MEIYNIRKGDIDNTDANGNDQISIDFYGAFSNK